MHKEKRSAAEEIIRQQGENWKQRSLFVTRTELQVFGGGSLPTPAALANLDCKGTGIPGAFRVGKKVCYPVDNVVKFMLDRLEV